jgi:LacI family transcriptional regulator
VGFDDCAVAGYTRPRLTTIRQDAAAFGAAAAERLTALCGGPVDAPPVVLPTSLVVRESCGARP